MMAAEAGIVGEDSIWRTRRLWSLWDMLYFWAPGFFSLAKEIGRITTQSSAAMKGKMPKDDIEKNAQSMKYYEEEFNKFGLRMCQLQTRRVLDALAEDKDLTGAQFHEMLTELYNRLFDECSTRHFVILSDDERKFYEPDAPLFGNDVEDKLPSVTTDIAEAGKCIGLSRPTAAVFHLMRVMETAVQKLGEKIGVALTDEKVWQVILDQTNSEMKKLEKSGQQYASITAHLYNVKLAWRNETMHPKATYTLEEANSIFTSVKNFMVDLVRVL